MKIALIGATGYAGSFILTEALNRNHQVTAIMRHPEKLMIQHKNLYATKADVYGELAPMLTGHDAAISAYSSGMPAPDIELHAKGVRCIIRAVKMAGIKRLLMVGGAGSLVTASGIQLLETDDFPPQWKNPALAARQALHILQQERDLDWTFLSPSALLKPGARTGKFRTGTNQLLTAQNGESSISNEDYAVAMINELERPQHIRQRFTVGY